MPTRNRNRQVTATTLTLAILAASPASILAANLYWDANGTTAGAGDAPSGTWGTNSYWNSDATGGGGGSFTPTTTGDDTLYFTAGDSSNNTTSAYTVTVDGTQSALGLKFQSIGAATITGGTINLGTGGIDIPRSVAPGTNNQAGVTINSNIALQGNQTWSSNSANATGFVVTGSVTGTANLTLSQSANRPFNLTNSVNHTGTLTGTGNNTNGTIDVTGNIGSNVTDVIVNGTTTLRLSGNNSYSGNVTVGGTNFGIARLTIGSNTALTAGSNVTLTATTATATSTLNLGNGANSYDVTVAGLNTDATTGSNIVTNNSTGTGTGTLTVNPDGAAAPADSTFGGIIQDGATAKVALTKAGSQTLTLTGTNSYTGATTVTGGKLLVNGTHANSAVTVNGGTLGGSGTVAAVTVNAGGTLAPGNSIGTINITGNLSLAGALDVELGRDTGTPTSDRTNVTGTVTFSDGADLKLTLYSGLDNAELGDIFYLVSNDDSDAITGKFTKLNGTATPLSEGSLFDWNSRQWQITYQANYDSSSFIGGNDLAIQVVPEPAALALLCLGGVALLRRRRNGCA
ncbi:MAG: autotransporter-associated beta strand repeat-containing protein [Lentisphaeria bacterium]|jgi:autotransporter-associated beta strand protein